MSYADDIKRFQIVVRGRSTDLLVGIAQEAQRSIVEGSPLTGAPGQPVDTGYLKNSWQLVFAPDMSSATIGTNAAYAPVIEHNSRAAFDPKGEMPPPSAAGRSVRAKNLPFGKRGGQVGPSEGGDRVTIRSAVGGHHSVALTVANADNLQRHVLSEMGQ